MITSEAPAAMGEVTSGNTRPDPDRLSRLILALVFVVALLPRLTGLITFDNADENPGASVRILTGELSGGASQTLPLINYLHAVSYCILYGAGRLIGVWHSVADFRAQYFQDKTPFIFAMRLLAACWGALSAPVACTIGRRLGLSKSGAITLGLMVALLPVNVWLSHVAKPDSAVATALLLVAWSLLYKTDEPLSRRADLMLGLFVALAISFKQTAIFLLVPLGAGLVLLLRYQCHLPWQRLLRGSAISLLTFVFAWAVLNIGILVDVRGFLEYQRATAIVMRREAVWLVTAQQVLAMLAKNTQGVTAAGLLAWLLAPCIRRDARFLVLWLAAVVGCVAFVVTSGGGIKVPRYLLPYSELGFALGCLAVLSLAAKKGIRGIAGIVGVLVIAGMELAGSVEVVRQAMEMPISDRCVNAIRQMADPTRDRVLGAPANIRQLQCMQAAEDEYRRHERLARKYGVNLLERAREHRPENRRQPVEGSFYILPMPFALGGMEDLSPDAAARAVRPYWWPVQPEEWELDYWTKQGFTIAVVSNEAAMLACRAPAYRSLHQQIRARGRLMVQLPTRRSLFDEREIRIYRLPPRSEPPGHE